MGDWGLRKEEGLAENVGKGLAKGWQKAWQRVPFAPSNCAIPEAPFRRVGLWLHEKLGVFQWPLTLILLQKYPDTNGRHIVIQIGGVYTTFCQKEGILLQKYRTRNGRRIAILTLRVKTGNVPQGKTTWVHSACAVLVFWSLVLLVPYPKNLLTLF